jgi:hypothetical protein
MRHATNWAEWVSKCSPHVRERLVRFNGPEGPKEGDMTRGWRPTQTEYNELALQGGRLRVPDHKIPAGARVRRIGRRAWVNRMDMREPRA